MGRIENTVIILYLYLITDESKHDIGFALLKVNVSLKRMYCFGTKKNGFALICLHVDKVLECRLGNQQLVMSSRFTRSCFSHCFLFRVPCDDEYDYYPQKIVLL